VWDITVIFCDVLCSSSCAQVSLQACYKHKNKNTSCSDRDSWQGLYVSPRPSSRVLTTLPVPSRSNAFSWIRHSTYRHKRGVSGTSGDNKGVRAEKGGDAYFATRCLKTRGATIHAIFVWPSSHIVTVLKWVNGTGVTITISWQPRCFLAEAMIRTYRTR